MKNPFKKTIEIHHKYDILPPFDWEQATSESAKEYFKKLTRVQMMEVQDRDEMPEIFWDEYHTVFGNIKTWPIDEEVYELLNLTKQGWGGDTSLEFQVDALKKQVTGIQKRLDRVLKIIENTEVTMSAKTALSM